VHESSAQSASSEPAPSLIKKLARDPRLPAIAAIALWLACVTLFSGTHCLFDEDQHQEVVIEIARRGFFFPDDLPMIPGWHALCSLLVPWFGTGLLPMRVVSALSGIIAVFALDDAGRSLHLNTTHRALLMFQPLLFPFFGLAYTDALALAYLGLAIAMNLRGRHWLSALALGGGVLVRQTTLVWLIVLLARTLWTESITPSRRLVLRSDAPKKCAPYLVVLAGFGAFALLHGRLTAGRAPENQPGFNAAQIWVFGLFVLAFWAPIWLRHWRAATALLTELTARSKPLAWSLLAGLSAVWVVSSIYFRNPHRWNHEHGFVRNWPLRLMGRVTLSRPILIFAALIGLCALLVYLLKARSFELWLVVVLTLSMLATTVIVEPRYYIAPFVLGTLFARFPKQDQRRLLAWQIALSAAGCILIFWRVLW
jgi:hypothetical protein